MDYGKDGLLVSAPLANKGDTKLRVLVSLRVVAAADQGRSLLGR